MEAAKKKDNQNYKSSWVLKKVERYLGMRRRSKAVAPTGCFTVYVGPERQRFVIKTEYANHPLFKMLLEDAELEYGYNCDGPLLLPCDAHLFCKILAEIDGACSPFNPAI